MSKLARLFVILGIAGFLGVTMLPDDADARGRGGMKRGGAAAHGRVVHTPAKRPPAARPPAARPPARRTRARHRHAYREWDEWRDRRRRWVIGTTITAATFAALTCTSTRYVINGVYYYSCGDAWYRRAYAGTTVTYVVVNAPPGY